MPINLTGNKIKDTYSQLLHIDGGPAGAEKVVHSGTGVATALSLGTGSASVDNIKIDGNTISSTDTNGNINITPITHLIASQLSSSGDPSKLAEEIKAGTVKVDAAAVDTKVAEIKALLKDQVKVAHPEIAGLDEIAYVMFRDRDPDGAVRTCTTLKPGRVDRSPCGTY